MKTRTNVSVKALAIAIGLALAGNALIVQATVQVDLRFADGSKTQVAAPGDFAIDVWVRVVGSDPAKRDGLENIYGYVQSVQIRGGAINGGAGVGIVENAAAPGGAFTVTPLPGMPGIPQDITLDGIQDWGTRTSVLATPIKYSSTLADPELPQVRGSAPVYGDTPGGIAQTIANGTEYKVGTLTFHIDTANYAAFAAGAATRVDWMRPLQGGIPWQISYPDEIDPPDITNAHYLPSDPEVNSVEFTGAQPAAGYSYATAASSPRIAKVQLPDIGGDAFDLYAPADEAVTPPAAPGLAPGLSGAESDGAVRALAPAGNDWVLIASGVTAGSLYSLPYPVSALQVLGINPAAGIDPNDPSAFPVNFFYEGDAAGAVTRVALTPEPASLALLSLGSLTLLRRRRR